MSKKLDSALDAIRKLTPEQIRESLREGLARHEQDEEDKRALTGKYAPPSWACRTCGDLVTAVIDFPWNGVIGGLPSNGHVTHWQCDGCGLMYGKPPKETP